MKQKRVPKAFLLLPLLAAAGAAAAFVLLSLPAGTPDAATVLAKAQAVEEEVLSQLTEGKALNIQDRTYRRYGPAAEMIRQRGSDWYLPESYVSDMWAEIDAQGKITRMSGWAKGENGEVFQKVATQGDKVITYSVRTGAEMRAPLSGMASAPNVVGFLQATIERWKEQVDSGSVKIAGEEKIAGREAIILDGPTRPLPPNQEADGSNGYSIPYLTDLDPVAIFDRIAVDKSSFVPFRWSVVVVDSFGNEYVVEESQRLAFEVVDASQVPAVVIP